MPDTESHAEPLVDLDVLAGTRVRLRELREADLPTLSAWMADPRITPYQLAGPPHPRPASVVTETIKGWNANEGMDCGYCIVTLDDDQLVGHAALFDIRPKDRCGTVGIFLGPEYHGSGFGSDALQVLIRYGFTELGLHRIELDVLGFNTRAMAAYRKVGFVEEGRRRAAVYRNGTWHDDVKMGMLRSEWDARQSPGTTD
jgi:RimJ/RimL family protein N-acetyltransferase